MAFHLIVPLMLYALTVNAAAFLFPVSALAATAIGALIALPPLWILYERDQRQRGCVVVWPARPGRMFGWILLLGMTACIACNGAINLSGIGRLFPGFKRVAVELYAPPFAVQVTGTVLLIPAVEELIFRGQMFAAIRDRTSFRVAAVGSAMLFGIYHGNVVQGLYAFCLGLLMAWLYERCGTILAPYLFHMAANFTSICMTLAPDQGMARTAGSAAASACLMALSFYKLNGYVCWRRHHRS